ESEHVELDAPAREARSLLGERRERRERAKLAREHDVRMRLEAHRDAAAACGPLACALEERAMTPVQAVDNTHRDGAAHAGFPVRTAQGNTTEGRARTTSPSGWSSPSARERPLASRNTTLRGPAPAGAAPAGRHGSCPLPMASAAAGSSTTAGSVSSARSSGTP